MFIVLITSVYQCASNKLSPTSSNKGTVVEKVDSNSFLSRVFKLSIENLINACSLYTILYFANK